MRALAVATLLLAGCSSPADPPTTTPTPTEECPKNRVCGEGWSYVPNDSEIVVQPSSALEGAPSETVPGHQSSWRMVDEGNNRFAYAWTVDCGLEIVCRNPKRGMYGCTEVARTFEC